MKKIKNILLIIIIIIFSIIFIGCSEKNKNKDIELYPAYEVEGNIKKWGYIDKKGNFKIKPKYDTTYEYKDGYALVEKDGKFGVLDDEGIYLIPIEYSKIVNLEYGNFVAYKDNSINIFINSEYTIDISERYLNVEGFGDGLFLVSKMGKDGKLKYGYIDKVGEEVIKPIYDFASNFIDGKAFIKQDDKIKVINKKGKIKKDIKYNNIKNLYDGKYYSIEEKNKKGLIDYNGEVIVEPIYNNIKDVFGNYIIVGNIVKGVELFGVIDFNNNIVLPIEYIDIEHLGNDILSVSKEKEETNRKIYMVTDIKGVPIVEDKFYNVKGEKEDLNENLISVCNKEETYYIDKNGEKQEQLPILKGIGELYYDGVVIKAYIEDEIIYFNNKDEVIWEADYILNIDDEREIVKKNIRNDEGININYPLFVGFKDREIQDNINEKIEEKFIYIKEDKPILESESYKYYKSGYEVEIQDEFVVIERNVRLFEKGSLKEEIYKDVINVDLLNGEIYKVKDILKEGSHYLNKLNELKNNAYKELEGLEDNKVKDIIEDDGFKIEEEKICFYLNYNENQENLVGYKKICIDCKDLKDIFNRENRYIREKVFKEE